MIAGPHVRNIDLVDFNLSDVNELKEVSRLYREVEELSICDTLGDGGAVQAFFTYPKRNLHRIFGTCCQLATLPGFVEAICSATVNLRVINIFMVTFSMRSAETLARIASKNLSLQSLVACHSLLESTQESDSLPV